MGFADKIHQFSVDVPEQLSGTSKKIAIDFFSGVIRDTPVDTGRLRGNWQCTRGEPASGELDVTDKSGQETINKMVQTVDSAKGDFVAYLTNNLAYAAVAEFGLWKDKDGKPANGPKTTHGYSIQAPSGMVGLNVSRINIYIKQAIAEMKRP
ncbi:HK97 gp10 family phage protein [Salmonella enterica]|uniref:HK97 gp10 family phage protein n=4 Tax=Salmonella enterica TaxID=28901 RepID=A0A5U8JHK2_SALET|nr:HK97 gp10 family phage protein [Salmonella enterica]EAA6844270.1 HK97 gp10 family phage protein [Salmonella enterica subsp. enterica serovar Pensacola]EBR7996448.1 HK97 gp10 family phage protein [Salmonella enterica subsp. enterica serovar Panama]EBW8395219.1 HK97 gp10 family phage protein [Salmonella enterica subsp. enterica serovar Florida]ECI2309076.1 HK97 gp10 family phage protein [Salmonella enterica subsp. enterica serovar Infantis]ECO0901870.1 HK97 gp10 family phage protein [Salmonel